ncbi:hypothetical protein [Paenibacillus piscarius]|uniref:hypothetical protein n=1 Tax=Paenibacillus piscarius TaxID=1089681 RepID=UPI001EE866D0|nr:hypothetical protein [Paenibacillus piscarius]
MGVESFFVKLLVKEQEGNNKSISNLISRLTEWNINCVPRNKHELELEKFLILTIHADENRILEVSIEGCFSWFSDCIVEIYKISEIINEKIFQIKVGTSRNGEIPIQNKEEFCNAIQKDYYEKYNDFLNRYGITDVKCLPRENFYNYFKKYKQKSLLKKL